MRRTNSLRRACRGLARAFALSLALSPALAHASDASDAIKRRHAASANEKGDVVEADSDEEGHAGHDHSRGHDHEGHGHDGHNHPSERPDEHHDH